MCQDCIANADYRWDEGGEDPGEPECASWLRRAEAAEAKVERLEAAQRGLFDSEDGRIVRLQAELRWARDAWDAWADHSQRRHDCDWGYSERPEGFYRLEQEEKNDH